MDVPVELLVECFEYKPSVVLSPLKDSQENHYISYMYIGLKLEECFMPECDDNFVDELEKIWNKLLEVHPDDINIHMRYRSQQEYGDD